MAANKNVLVTGGAGYIGSHTVVELLSKGFVVTVLDNLDNSDLESLERVKTITKCADDAIRMHVVDLLDMSAVEKVFEESGPFCCCIHFAGLKAVGESCHLPLHYYANNINGTLNLLHVCQKFDMRNFVFSSSATVYGEPDYVPIDENHPLRSTNPYGKTKLFIEEILRDVAASEKGKWNIVILRYFNPIGAHESGLIGEDPKGYPNNLVPFIAQVAIGKREKLSVFGDDYDTEDGTGMRDYLHVVDLARAHVKATNKAVESVETKLDAVVYNLGTGNGVSVLQMVKAFEKACGKTIPYEISPRRAGDVKILVAEPSRAKAELGWSAEYSIDKACADGWKWQQQNPNGFRKEGAANAGPPKNEDRKALIFQLFG